MAIQLHDAGGVGAFGDGAQARVASFWISPHSSQFCDATCSGVNCTVTPFGSSSFALLASNGSPGVARRSGHSRCPAHWETNIQPSSPMNLMPLGKRSETVILMLPG